MNKNQTKNTLTCFLCEPRSVPLLSTSPCHCYEYETVKRMELFCCSRPCRQETIKINIRTPGWWTKDCLECKVNIWHVLWWKCWVVYCWMKSNKSNSWYQGLDLDLSPRVGNWLLGDWEKERRGEEDCKTPAENIFEMWKKNIWWLKLYTHWQDRIVLLFWIAWVRLSGKIAKLLKLCSLQIIADSRRSPWNRHDEAGLSCRGMLGPDQLLQPVAKLFRFMKHRKYLQTTLSADASFNLCFKNNLRQYWSVGRDCKIKHFLSPIQPWTDCFCLCDVI